MDGQETSLKRPLIDRFGSIAFIVFVFLLPLFVFPSSAFPFQSGKATLIFFFVFGLFIFWLVSRLKVGSISLPWSPLSALVFALPVVSALSALFSSSVTKGLIGRGFELDTALSIFSFSLLFFLVPQIFRTKQSIFNLYLALLASFFVLFIFSLFRLVAGEGMLTLGVLNSSVSNLVGSWNDLGVFSGLIAVLSLVMLEIVPPKGVLRALLYAALGLSLLALAVINFTTVWIALGFFALALFVYSFTFARAFGLPKDEDASTKGIWRVPRSPLIVILVALLFVVTGSQFVISKYPSFNLGGQIAQALNVSQLEARPSWSTTLGIAENTLKTKALLGAGPNQFASEWVKYRPKIVNESAFWNADFNFGIGIVPSTFVSLGILGVVVWLLFLIFFLYQGVKTLRYPHEDLFSYYLSVTSFTGALYLWLMAIFYTTSTVPFVLAFVMTGVFMATVLLHGGIREKTFSFTEEPSTRFVALLVTIVCVAGALAGFFFVGQKSLGTYFYGKALLAYNASLDLQAAEQNVRRSIAIDGEDLYYRGLSQIALLNLNKVANQVTADTPAEQIRTLFQTLLGGAIQAAQAARDENPSDYQNWISLAQAYESVVPLKIAGAYDNAKSSYEEAIRRNPTSPSLRLALARLEVQNQNTKAAKEYIAQALDLKSNYIDAIFLLSQIEVSEGNVREAITSVESASVLAPNDATVFLQLGFLYYNTKEYQKAIQALERAVGLESSYANARYFLGLSYDKVGRVADAITQFQRIEATNGDNQEVKFILSNLQAGRGALESVKPPLDDKPEKRSKLPIEESKGKNDL